MSTYLFPVYIKLPGEFDMIFRLIRSTVPSLGFLIPTVFCCCGSLAQSALPPSVSVQPVLSRQVTETGDFVGRVAALNKVDIVARVTGFIGKRNFSE
jgi:multidrug efflux pump subunit AcrA (membrane-fusion protein)